MHQIIYSWLKKKKKLQKKVKEKRKYCGNEYKIYGFEYIKCYTRHERTGQLFVSAAEFLK